MEGVSTLKIVATVNIIDRLSSCYGKGTIAPCPVKNSHKKDGGRAGSLYFMFLAPTPSARFLDPLLVHYLHSNYYSLFLQERGWYIFPTPWEKVGGGRV